MKNTMLFLFLFLFLICLFSRFNIYGAEKTKNDSIVIYFKPGTLEVSEKKLDILFNKSLWSSQYRSECSDHTFAVPVRITVHRHVRDYP